MRNQASWLPTKYVSRGGRLRATNDKTELGLASRLIADRVAQAYDQALKVHARGRLLDMGCGKAPLFGAYAPYVSEVQCIDWENSFHGSDYLDRTCDLTTRIPYPDAGFDTIILSDVLEHLPEPMNCWREMNRLLAPSGKVILNVPFYYPIHEAPFDFYRYTEFALRRFAESTGFEVEELAPIGGPIEILADVTAKLLLTARLRAPAIVIQSVAARFANTSLGSRVSKRAGRHFPLGYFMVAVKAEP